MSERISERVKGKVGEVAGTLKKEQAKQWGGTVRTAGKIVRGTAVLLAISLLSTACGVGNGSGIIPGGSLSGIVEPGRTEAYDEILDLMETISPEPVKGTGDLKTDSSKLTDFAVRLFQWGLEDEKNTLISPLSVLCALAMTANGAEGKTLAQMESVLGMPVEELNTYLYSFLQALPQEKGICQLKLANSIWFTADERFTVDQEFLQKCGDYYEADIYRAPFHDRTCQAINDWIRENTDGMIPHILDKISQDAVMYLVNALAFEAEWADIYKENQVREGVFTTEDGREQTVEFMSGIDYKYLENEDAVGFMKYYKDEAYAFVALLPREGLSVNEYVSSLNGEELQAMLSTPGNVTVQTGIPKFETEYSMDLSQVLSEMGMPDAFRSDRADFSGLGTSEDGKNLYISRILHKTFISVAEKGTRAGAATMVEISEECSTELMDGKKVILDRPFVYMLIHCETNIPVFVGTMMDVMQ